MPDKRIKVLLITMPFGPHYSPSLGLSILKSTIEAEEIKCKIKYYNLKFAAIIGVELFGAISSGSPLNQDMLGEWLFSDSLFHNQSSKDVEEYLTQIIDGGNVEHSKNFVRRNKTDFKIRERIKEVREKVEPFLNYCLNDIIEEKPDIVGFTSVFQQQVASLSLAKRIKEYNQNILVVFGGANNEGAMGAEVIKQFPFVDAIVTGEGENVFPELVARVFTGEPFDEVQGVVTKATLQNKKPLSGKMVRNMDDVPYPDFEEYFQALTEYGLNEYVNPRLMYETSRGCWWGEVSHCTFCGLNGEGMKFRSKSADRALKELKFLSNKYPNHPISVVDNILDMDYFKTFIPLLIKEKMDLELFYEVKANLKKEQLVLLKNAGINIIQPGIESLSDEVLKLMGKGVRAIQNIQLLKWSKELGITAEWNMIWGFPGETLEDYQRMAEAIPALVHLNPPYSASKMRLDRFSPNFNQYQKLGFRRIYPYPSYKYIYPYSDEAIHNLAYYFAYEYQVFPESDYTAAFKKEIAEWQKVHEESDLFYVVKGDVVLVWDFRPTAKDPLIVLRGLEAVVFLACDKMKTIGEIMEIAEKQYGKVTNEQILRILDNFNSKMLILSNEVHFINLALKLGEYQPGAKVLKRLNEFLNSHADFISSDGQNSVVDLKKL